MPRKYQRVAGNPRQQIALEQYRFGKILMSFSPVSPLKYFSFLHQPLPVPIVLRVLPEVQELEQIFNSDSVQYWHAELLHHNSLAERGFRMGLCSARLLPDLRCTSLDEYMLRFRCLEMAKGLDLLYRFVSRILPKIAKSPSARVWLASGAVMMTRESWCVLCGKIVDLVKGLERAGRRFRADERPEYPVLISSAARVMELLDKRAIHRPVVSSTPARP